MATAQTIITDALMEIGVLAEGETPSSEMSDYALRALNRLMQTLSNYNEFAYYAREATYALTGQASFTVGLTGNLVTERPIKITSATVVKNNVTYPVDVISKQEWDSLQYKTSTGSLVDAIYYEGTMPNGIVHVYPLATCSLTLGVQTLVASFSTLTTALSMPPGYEEGLITNLAVNISPAYQVTLSQITLKNARDSLNAIKVSNRVVPIMSLDHGLSKRQSSILDG